MARSLRTELSLAQIDPLSPRALAAHFDVMVVALTDIPGLDQADIHQLLEVDPGSWSAITVSAAGREAIITNTGHSGGRPSSDIMHELAHILLGHEPSTVFFAGEEQFALRGYNNSAEEEANWMAGALLLPRDSLVHIRAAGLSDAQACESYFVSPTMLRYRMDITGVNRQFGRQRRRSSAYGENR